MTVTVNNQLFLLMLAEKYLNSGIEVISTNTDGCVAKYRPDQRELIYSIDRKWEKLTGHTLEYAEYSKFIQTSVNDYISLKTNGELKHKGDFEIDKELHKDTSMRIVSLAVQEYFINNIPIVDTITNHTDIFDFCLAVRMTKDWVASYKYIENQDIISKDLSKTVRYYASKRGGLLFKTHIKDNRCNGITVGQNITIFNNYIEKDIKDYNIDYLFYIKETRKIIDKIENGLQWSLF